MRRAVRYIAAAVLAGILVAGLSTVRVRAWGPQGHRLVALLGTVRLTSIARNNVVWLFDFETLADVSS
jgi:hypothetical protein